MIIARLAGGLGNQMFQYIAARELLGDKFTINTGYLSTSLGAQGFESISNVNNPTPLSNQRGTYSYDYTTCANDFVVDGSGRITYTNPTC